jgi:hypothetical protein
MGWRRTWPERKPRPKVRTLSRPQRDEILLKLLNGIESSPVLVALNFRVRTLRGRFYVEQVWQHGSTEKQEAAVMGRLTPLVTPKGLFLLEAEKSNANWYEVKTGFAKSLIDHIANDTKGTFHGLGALNKSLVSGGNQRLPIEMDKQFSFTYESTGEICSAQEALYHFFGVPITVIAEPSGWYMYHRKPWIIEVSDDLRSVFVRFTSSSLYGSTFGGTCLYTNVHEDEWDAYPIKPNRSENIASSISWLKKREWNSW